MVIKKYNRNQYKHFISPKLQFKLTEIPDCQMATEVNVTV